MGCLPPFHELSFWVRIPPLSRQPPFRALALPPLSPFSLCLPLPLPPPPPALIPAAPPPLISAASRRRAGPRLSATRRRCRSPPATVRTSRGRAPPHGTASMALLRAERTRRMQRRALREDPEARFPGSDISASLLSLSLHPSLNVGRRPAWCGPGSLLARPDPAVVGPGPLGG